MIDYEEQANKFLSKTGTEFSAKFLKHGKHFEDDKEDRDIYGGVYALGKDIWVHVHDFKTNELLDSSTWGFLEDDLKCMNKIRKSV